METTNLAIASVNSQTLSPKQAEFSKMFAMLPVKDIDELMQSQAPAVNMVDRESLTLCISLAIGKYLNFIGCPNSMTEDAIFETAQMMIDTHPHITVDAIKSFFYECKRGTYGFHYNKMDGSKLLIWYDKFVNDYYRKLDDMEYAKHQNTKGDLASPLALETEEGEPIDFDELYASFHGKTKEQMIREREIADVRKEVCNANMHLYDEMPIEQADKIIEEAIIKELQSRNLLTF